MKTSSVTSVPVVRVWNKDGTGEFKTVDNIEDLPDGTKLYTAAERDQLKAINKELLEALEGMLANDWADLSLSDKADRCEAGRAAIAKARGTS
jgi:hypothetical protein